MDPTVITNVNFGRPSPEVLSDVEVAQEVRKLLNEHGLSLVRQLGVMELIKFAILQETLMSE